MVTEPPAPSQPEGVEYLKQVSRIKHRILSSYLGAWAAILGTQHKRLAYIDCFAGGGFYKDERGELLPGSPLRALDVAKSYLLKHADRSLRLVFVEEDRSKARALEEVLRSRPDLPSALSCRVIRADARDLVEQLLASVKSHREVIPTFFFVDPYGYPLSVPTLRKLLRLGKSELLVNLMWFRINMDLNNPDSAGRMDRLFGHRAWRNQDFVHLVGKDREVAFLNYFATEVGARYNVRWVAPYSPEDQVSAPEKRRKYYLIHFSNHPRAALVMKEVMRRAKEQGERLYPAAASQLMLFEFEPGVGDLKFELRKRFAQGTRITFQGIREETAESSFVEAEYRAALKELENEGALRIKRIQSKKSGLAAKDIVEFL